MGVGACEWGWEWGLVPNEVRTAWRLSTDGRLPILLHFGGIIPYHASTSSSCFIQPFQSPFRPPHPTPVQAKGNTPLLRLSSPLNQRFALLRHPAFINPNPSVSQHAARLSPLPLISVILNAGSSLTSPMSISLPTRSTLPSIAYSFRFTLSSPSASHSN